MRTPAPSLEDVWTERIFAAFNRNRENSLVNRDSKEASQHTGTLRGAILSDYDSSNQICYLSLLPRSRRKEPG